MANRLKMNMVQAVVALFEQGWSRRRIAEELGIDRETVTNYLKRWQDAKPAIVHTGSQDDFGSKPAIVHTGSEATTIMTSNRPLEDWGKLLSDVPSATAILDRFLHHAEIIPMNGRSYRLRNQAAQAAAAKEEKKSSPEEEKPAKEAKPSRRPAEEATN